MKNHSAWQKYVDLLEKKRVPEPARRWYVYRVECFLKAHPGKKFQDLSAPEFESYFRGLSRDRTLTDWQFIQAVDTLRILLVNLCKSPLAQHIDWDYWKDSSRSLDAGHGTLAVDNTVDAVLNNRRQAVFSASAERHDVLKEMVRLIRVPYMLVPRDP